MGTPGKPESAWSAGIAVHVLGIVGPDARE